MRPPSRNPAFLLEPALEAGRDFFNARVGSALDPALPARLPVQFHRAANDETHRVAGRNGDGSRRRRPRTLATAGLRSAAAEFAQSLWRHLEAFDRRLQLRRAGTESNREPFNRAAWVDGQQIAPRSEERRVGKECRSRWSP